MLPLYHYIPIFLISNVLFLVSGCWTSSPFRDCTVEENRPSNDEPFEVSKRNDPTVPPVEEDRPRILCGEALIRTLKEQCGARGTFSPYHKRVVRELIKMSRGLHDPKYSDTNGSVRLRKRFDDICEVYLRYEPESPLAQCCCLGCTKAYLENFCAEA
ncbi:hypothetical protein Aperf_G00000110012 [Anoplocephala perfoliata]